MSKTTSTLPKSLLAFFWHFIKMQWKWFLLLQICCFAWSLDHTLFPYIISLLIDAITKLGDNRSEMWSVVAVPLAMGAALWITLEVGYRSGGYILAKVTPRLESSVRLSMFDYVQRHSYSYFGSNLAGALSNRISEMPKSMSDILRLIIMLFAPVLLALVISTVLFARLHFLFGLILFTWMAVHIGICLIFAKKCALFSDIQSEARATLTGKIVDSFSNHLNVRLFARHKYEHDYLSRFQKDEQEKHVKSLIYIERMKIALGVACFLGPGVLLNWFMLYSWQNGSITTGDVVFIFNTAWNITMMGWFAGLEIPTFFKEIGVCQQALSIVKTSHEIVDVPNATTPQAVKGEITFDNVTFNYIPNQSVFQNKSIQINAGSKVGLVGFSGSGKTTFVHLILRYFDVEEGQILIDGKNIATFSLDALRTHIAMIPQDASLFHRTLMENIRYGRLEATDDEVIEAAKQAKCHEFIDKLPEKYHTMAGERGVKLSGGQRQRIAIARALLKNAPILILDEATSALDSVTEKDIQEGLDHLMQSRTTIVIAHRLSTLSGMDRILVFKDGKVIEDGSPDELLAMEGHYAKMWNMQAGGFLPEMYEEEE